VSARLAKPTGRITVEEFLAWTSQQPGSDRYELVSGEVVGMAGDRVRHNRLKFAAARALDDAVHEAAQPCTVFTDGVGVRIDEWTLRIPDASVQCGPEADPEAMVIEPLIVLEVTSPSSVRSDEDHKLLEYMSVPSIQHYVIVYPGSQAIVHHQRGEAGTIATRIMREGVLEMHPPGLRVGVDRLLTADRERGIA
jgi:Uma2 family endonuclease